MNGLEQLLPFVLIAAVFWFLLIRPQRKRQQAMVATQRSITVGDEVLLGAGIVGRVVGSDDDFLQLELSPGAEMKIIRGAVVRVLTPHEQVPDATDVSSDPTDPTRDH